MTAGRRHATMLAGPPGLGHSWHKRCREARGECRSMIFRQLFDSVSSTYTYLLASQRGGEGR